jgi:hypothetical protein
MKMLWTTCLATLSLTLLAAGAQACHRGGGCGYAAAACYDAPCAPAVTISYVEQKVKAYRPEWKEEKVKVDVVRCSFKTETVPVKHIVMKPFPVKREATVMKQFMEDRDVTVMRPVTVDREVTVMRPFTEKQKRTVMVPYTETEKRKVTVMTRVAREVVRDVCVCQRVPVTCVDPCTGCTYTTWQAQQVVQKVKGTVWDCVPAERDIVVNVCKYREQQETVDVIVCRPVKEKIKVIECEAVKEKVKVCVYRPVKTMVDAVECRPVEQIVNVTRCVPVTETVPTVVTRRYCVMVQYETTIRVPVCTPVAVAPCEGSGAVMPRATY